MVHLGHALVILLPLERRWRPSRRGNRRWRRGRAGGGRARTSVGVGRARGLGSLHRDPLQLEVPHPSLAQGLEVGGEVSLALAFYLGDVAVGGGLPHEGHAGADAEVGQGQDHAGQRRELGVWVPSRAEW